jgi:hypothetical protein
VIGYGAEVGMKDCKKHYSDMYETRLGTKKCPWCDIDYLRGIMVNDISSAMDDCVDLGMTAAEMCAVVKTIIGKAAAP